MRSRRFVLSSNEPPGAVPTRSRLPLVLAVLTGGLTVVVCYLVLSLAANDTANIGRVSVQEHMGYEPIDVVYTWVNGTDPRWKGEKEFWHKHWIALLTGQPLPTRDAMDNNEIKGKDDSNSDNRFRDNEELRYSLRSIETYAPWIRNVYIVTDGQVPSWLNLEAPRLQIVKHKEIFKNQSHLPVFSSPAIEWNLDNIPGLSKNFLYLNDDVFFGATVHPEDFVSPRGVQKVYFAWEVPDCAQGCYDHMLKNGECNAECNVTMCDFDLGDCGCDVSLNGDLTCDPVKIEALQQKNPDATEVQPALADHLCSESGHYTWISDNTCDMACNQTSCGFDGGDCGTHLLTYLHAAAIDEGSTLMTVPRDVHSVYLNLTGAFGVDGIIESASHDNSELIRAASVIESNVSLLLVFGRDPKGQEATASALLTVRGRDQTKKPMTLEFSVVRGETVFANEAVEAEVVNSGAATFLNVSMQDSDAVLPLQFNYSSWSTRVEAVERKDTVKETTESASTAFSSSSDGEQSTTIEDSVEQNALIEIYIPFSEPNKDLPNGNVQTLITNVRLRFHNDQGDDDKLWDERQTCQLIIPAAEGETTPVGVLADTNEGHQDADPLDVVETIEMSVDAGAEPSSDGLVDVLAFDSTTNPELIYFPKNDQTDATNKDEPVCVVVNSGIRISVRVPKFQDIQVSSEAAEQALLNPINAATAGAEGVAAENSVKTGSSRPQIADGHVCFYDEAADDKQFCFALAVGHFYAHGATLLTPPKMRIDVPYEPYNGENPAYREFTECCRDISLRVVGVLPLKCGLNEIPAVEEEFVDQAALIEQARIANELEGRRLACESRRQRLEDERVAAEKAWIWRAFGKILSPITRLFASSSTVAAHDDGDDDDVCDSLPPQVASSAPEISEENAQALLSQDTFGDSLRFVNRLYTRAFGKAPSRRRVPSHMPFLLNREIIAEIKARWGEEITATSAHRFRHPNDMQFSFSYYHYLLNRRKARPPTLTQVWHDYLDVNHNGVLDENEILTVASLAHGDIPPQDFLERVKTCLRPPKKEKVREKLSAQGTVRIVETLTPYATFETLERSCPEIAQQVLDHVRYEQEFELMTEQEITFHMLSDQYSFAWGQMLGTRARRTKFVCINDDMKYPTPSVSQILHELFLVMWPKRSQFELPYHLRNRYDHIDVYRDAKIRRRRYLYVAIGIACILLAVFWSDLKKVFGFTDIARARRESSSQLAAEVVRQQEEEEAKNK